MPDTMELPCIACGDAAAQVNVRAALGFVPSAVLLAIKGAARLAGQRLELDAPNCGVEPAWLSRVLEVRCVACVDSEKPVDNNPENAK